MTMVKLGPGFVDLEGKQGGVIWRKDVCGQHIQAYPRLIEHEPSPKQKIRRNAFRFLLNKIKHANIATPDFAIKWQNYADNHKRTNKKGETYSLAWWAMFIGYNINSYIKDGTWVELPPVN